MPLLTLPHLIYDERKGPQGGLRGWGDGEDEGSGQGRYGESSHSWKMCTLPGERVFILFRFQYSSQFISCSNVKRGGVGGNGISKLFFPSYFEHFKKDRVVVQTSNKGNNYNPTQHR